MIRGTHFAALVQLAVILMCTGCIGLRDFEIPVDHVAGMPAIAGAVTVESVSVEKGGLFHQGFNSGFLGLFDYLFLIPKTQNIDSVIRASGAEGLEDYWRDHIEARLRATGAFAGSGDSVQVTVKISRAQKYLEGHGWVIPSWILNPLWTLCAGRNGTSHVVLDATFHVSVGPWSKEYDYRYDETKKFGLYYGRHHRQGAVLGEVCDLMVEDLRRDLARERARVSPTP